MLVEKRGVNITIDANIFWNKQNNKYSNRNQTHTWDKNDEVTSRME